MKEIFDGIITKYKEKEANIIFLLQETQEALGYVPKEAVEYFSEELEIAPSKFYGVSTFYSQFRMHPIGKNKITACCGTACHVKGAERILNGLKRELKLSEEADTTADNEFTLEKVACLGTCSFAPVVLVNGAVRGKTNVDTLVKEIKALRRKN